MYDASWCNVNVIHECSTTHTYVHCLHGFVKFIHTVKTDGCSHLKPCTVQLHT